LAYAVVTLFAEACLLALASIYAGLLEMLDHQILDCWSFTVWSKQWVVGEM
jgi:hypothetical protein